MSGTRDQAMEISVSVLARHTTAWERINMLEFGSARVYTGLSRHESELLLFVKQKRRGAFTKLVLHNEGTGVPG